MMADFEIAGAYVGLARAYAFTGMFKEAENYHRLA
jgi:hypothetical protein